MDRVDSVYLVQVDPIIMSPLVEVLYKTNNRNLHGVIAKDRNIPGAYSVYAPRSFALRARGVRIVHTGTHLKIPQGVMGVLQHYPHFQRPAWRVQTEVWAHKRGNGFQEMVLIVSNHGSDPIQVHEGEKIALLHYCITPEVTMTCVCQPDTPEHSSPPATTSNLQESPTSPSISPSRTTSLEPVSSDSEGEPEDVPATSSVTPGCWLIPEDGSGCRCHNSLAAHTLHAEYNRERIIQRVRNLLDQVLLHPKGQEDFEAEGKAILQQIVEAELDLNSRHSLYVLLAQTEALCQKTFLVMDESVPLVFQTIRNNYQYIIKRLKGEESVTNAFQLLERDQKIAAYLAPKKENDLRGMPLNIPLWKVFVEGVCALNQQRSESSNDNSKSFIAALVPADDSDDDDDESIRPPRWRPATPFPTPEEIEPWHRQQPFEGPITMSPRADQATINWVRDLPEPVPTKSLYPTKELMDALAATVDTPAVIEVIGDVNVIKGPTPPSTPETRSIDCCGIWRPRTPRTGMGNPYPPISPATSTKSWTEMKPSYVPIHWEPTPAPPEWRLRPDQQQLRREAHLLLQKVRGPPKTVEPLQQDTAL